MALQPWAQRCYTVTEFAEEISAEVLRGALRYPSETGSWQPGDTVLDRPCPVRQGRGTVRCVDLNEHLWQYRDHKVTLILAVTGKVEEQIVCDICGFVMYEVGDRPRSKLLNKAIAGAIKAWRAGQDEMLREVEEILRCEDK